MRMFFAALLSFAFFSPSFAKAEMLGLDATDGTKVTVGYQIVDETYGGRSIHKWVRNLGIHLYEPGKETTAVVVGTCKVHHHSHYQFTLQCPRPTGENWIHVPKDCRIEGETYAKGYVERTLPDLRISSFYGSNNEECTYELAIVRDGVWLTDPINGTHNFVLNF